MNTLGDVLFIAAIASSALLHGGAAHAAQVPTGCREPFETAELVEAVINRWDAWTVEELRAHWPDALETQDSPPTERHLPTYYAHFAQEGACGESFQFTAATHGTPQFLEQLELRFMSRELDDAEIAGKAFLKSFGSPFQLLTDGFDEWRLDENGWLHRDYRWDDPEIHVAIDIERHEDQFMLSVSYSRATKLDAPAPSRPEEPLRLHISPGEATSFALSRMSCVGDGVEPEELQAAREVSQRVQRELSRAAEWFQIVPAGEADYVVLLGAHWEEKKVGDSHRCVSADLELPGQRLGIAIDEHGPNWRQLETMDIAALELARGITELFQEQYYRLMNQRTEGR
jgi:hypothetical protein